MIRRPVPAAVSASTLLLALLGFVLAPAAAAEKADTAPLAEGCVEVQHILIAFAGTVPGKKITRSKEEAGELANEVLERAKKGEDFTALVEKYTADSAPGIYKVCDAREVPKGFYSRYGMVKSFGDVSFALQPGEIGMASWSVEGSPYGWHIIKRLR